MILSALILMVIPAVGALNIDTSNPVMVLGCTVIALLAFMRSQGKIATKLDQRLAQVDKTLRSQAEAQNKANELSRTLQEQVKQLSVTVCELTESLLEHIRDDSRHTKPSSD